MTNIRDIFPNVLFTSFPRAISNNCPSCGDQCGSPSATLWTSSFRESPSRSVRASRPRRRREDAWRTWARHLGGRRTRMSGCRLWVESARLRPEPAEGTPLGQLKIGKVHRFQTTALPSLATRRGHCNCIFYDIFQARRRSSWRTSAGWKTRGCCGRWPSWLWKMPCRWWSTHSKIGP